MYLIVAVAIVLLNLYVGFDTSSRIPCFVCSINFPDAATSICVEAIQEFLVSCLFMVGHSGNDVIQIIPRVDIVSLAGSQQRTDNRHVDRRLMITTEEIILSSQSDGPDCILRQIVVPKQASVLQTSHHVLPSCIGIGDGFTDLGTETILDTFRFHPCFHGLHNGSSQFLTFRPTLIIRHPCLIAAVLNPVYMLYLSQPIFSRFPVLVKGLSKMTADMYQTN